MKEQFRGVVWPQAKSEDVDGKPVYRYTVVGVLVTDTPIEGLDQNEVVIDGVMDRYVEEMGMAGALQRSAKFHAAYRLGTANSVLTSLGNIVGKPIKPTRK